MQLKRIKNIVEKASERNKNCGKFKNKTITLFGVSHCVIALIKLGVYIGLTTINYDNLCYDELHLMLIKYINTHYHPNAQIDLVKTINGYKQWRIITHEYDLSNAVIQPADNSVISNVTVEKSNDTIKITGEAYKIGFDSYKQRCFAVITSSTGEQHTYEVNLTDNGNDRYSGGYSTLNDKYKAANADEATVCVIMQTGDMYYRVY